jgi:hypothetical protein
MSIKQWFLNQITTQGSPARIRLFWDEDVGAAPGDTTSGTGWTVAKVGANNYRMMVNGSEISGGFATTIQPDNAATPTADETWNNPVPSTYTPPTLINANDGISTLYEYNGYFPAGTWTFEFPLIAVSNGGTQDGRLRMRVYKATRTSTGDGWENITELTTSTLIGSIVTNLTTSAIQNSDITWSAPQITLNNEFLIFKMAWHITGAANNNNADVLFRYGNTSLITSPEFRKRTYNIN